MLIKKKYIDANMLSNNKQKVISKIVGILILLTVLFFSSLSLTTAASSYVRSAPAYTFGHQTAPYTGGGQLFTTFNRSMCQAGQDFILQIDPLGCTPSVIRSDLLEEQEVVVFCPISATQLNPLIEIKDIDHIFITRKDVPKEVLTVGYYPAGAALGKWDPDINTPILGNIGYATIVLRRQPNESAMPDFVQGNLTAKLLYDIDNAFGTGRVVYYLPQLSDEEWNENYAAYGFWDGRGYLRLEGADNTGATIGVYSDRDVSGTGRLGEKTRIANLNLEKGGKPREIFLPGFNYCMGGLEIQLKDLENPDTGARLRIDSEVLEMRRGEKFLENRCEIKSITKQGINQKVEISCQEDERGTSFKGPTFLLRLNPKISLSVGGQEPREYGVGDFLYNYIDNKDRKEKSVYLGFIGNNGTGNTNNAGDLYIRVISIPTDSRTPTNRDKLTESEISSIAYYDKNSKGSDIRKNAVGEIASIGDPKILAQTLQIWKNILAGSKIGHLHYLAPADSTLAGTKIDIIGYSGPQNKDFSEIPPEMLKEIKDNYDKAMQDYKTLTESFSGERYPPNDVQTLGEQAFKEAIMLAESLEQRSTALQLCREFSENYGSVAPAICSDEYLLSNTQISGQSVVINGRTHIISFEGVREPLFKEFGLEISVSYPDGSSVSHNLSKNEIIYLNDSTKEVIQLIDLEEDFATLRTSLLPPAAGATTQPKTSTQKLKAEAETEESFNSRYSFRIEKINLQKVAKVTINPRVDYARTNATINFKIGIEKRAIQLSPEKTKERIETLNETIEKWTKISNGLGKVVEAGKAACLATAGALTIKNFFSNLGGKGIARQTVMKASGVGWYDKCQGMVKPNGPYDDVEACLLDKSDEIDASVNEYVNAMNKQNDEIKKLEEGISDTRFLGEKVVNTDALTKKLMEDSVFASDINSCKNKVQIIVGGKTINAVDISPINADTTSLTQARNLQLNCRLLSSSDPNVQEIAKSNVEKTFGEIYSNSRTEATRQTFNSQYGISPIVGSTKKLKEFPLTDVKTFGQVKGKFSGVIIPDDTYIATFIDEADAKEYFFTLTNEFVISQTYLVTNGVLSVADSKSVNPLGLALKKYDSKSYSNKYKNPQVRYYEADPYQGFPSVVPFDIKNGWYAAVKSNAPLLGALRGYDASAKVSSFYVCNVGQNGREENIGGDDICRGFYPNALQPPDFPGLSEQESKNKMNQAQEAIRQAQVAYKTGVSDITLRIAGIGSQRIKVGEPAANIPAIRCEDFMSPSDCNIMFNVCDPVICPSSRCNLGGAYHVKDVIQSGIAGSIALCLPNWPEVKVPICVSGVHAGLEGYLSVLGSYQQCLQTSLDTGQTVGICDELNSIYMCEFFWRQGLPLIKYAIPKVVGSVLGQNVRGGGEYLGVADAWSNAEKSIDYFSQYYAANSFAAFKARSAESVGGEICRNWVSLTGPKGNLFDALIAPDSPAQFYGRFEEIPYTTATNPPASQYKVFYHIYSGKDLPAYYQVYLRGTGGSFYQDTGFRRPVASGFIKTGDFKSETIDFTAPSGYKELCIVVNGQEVCGFKQVTTEFGINYLSEKYVQQQASQTDIKSEAECVSGSPSAFSFLNPNIQAGAEEVLNPAIYNRGIIRVCSTDNPGKTSDPAAGTKSSRWKEVGNCGSQSLKCWLDTDSVKTVVKNSNIEGQILGEVESQYLNALQKKGLYIDEQMFESLKKEIDNLKGKDSELIKKVNENIGKIYFNNQKAYLHLKRGNAYGNLAGTAYNIEKAKQKKPETPTTPPTETGKKPSAGEQLSAEQAQQCIEKFDRNGDFLITEDDDCKPIMESLDPFDEALAAECLSCIEQPVSEEAAKCGECGVICSKAECEALGCTFIPDPTFVGKTFPLIFNSCVPKEKTAEEPLTGPTLPSPTQVESRFADTDLFNRLSIYNNIIVEVSKKYNVEEEIIKAIIIQESYADTKLVTDNRGSYGLMQVSRGATIDVKKRYGFDATIVSININDFETDILNPKKNIYTGTLYYKILYDYYRQKNSHEDSEKIALAAYNWGRGNIQSNCAGDQWKNCQNIPNQVLQYVSNIIAYRDKLKETTSTTSTTPLSSIISSVINDDTDIFLSSFVYSTKISTPSGQIPINEIKIGDEILSVNPNTNQLIRERVLFLHEIQAKNILKIILSDGTILEVTPEHPFYDPISKAYKPIKEFMIGDKVLVLKTPNFAKEFTIKSMQPIFYYEGQPVYNLYVSGDFNNYLANGILVHNKYSENIDSEPELSELKKEIEKDFGDNTVKRWVLYVTPNTKIRCWDNQRNSVMIIPDSEKLRLFIVSLDNSAKLASRNNYGISISSSELYTLAMEEGLILYLAGYDDPNEEKSYYTGGYYCTNSYTLPINGLFYLGLDYFPSEVSGLKNGNFLRQNFNEYKIVSVDSDALPYAIFNNLDYGLEAIAARFAWTKWRFLNDAKNLGIDTKTLSEDQINFWTYYYYNLGANAGRNVLKKYVNNGILNDRIFIYMSGESVVHGRSARHNAIIYAAMVKFIRGSGVLSQIEL